MLLQMMGVSISSLTDPKTCIDITQSGGTTAFVFLMIFGVLFIAYLCMVLASVCDDYLTDSLEVMCERWGLSEDIAGVSLLALGGSLPELAIHTFAVAEGNEIGVATVIGSALFNLTLGLALVAFVTPPGRRVAGGPLLRDGVFYLFVLGLVLIWFRWDLKIYWYETLAMLVLYVLFLVLLYFTRNLCPGVNVAEDDAEVKRIKEEGSAEPMLGGSKQDSSSSSSAAPAPAGASVRKDAAAAPAPTEHAVVAVGEHEPEHAAAEKAPKKKGRHAERSCLMKYLNYPTDFLFEYTIPDPSNPKYTWLYPLAFFMSMIYVFGISFVLMSTVQWMACVTGLDQALSGLIILAVGASLPDAITMGVVASHGFGAMAVGGLLGSNIFDILVGLGLPWMLSNALRHPVDLSSERVFVGACFATASVVLIGFTFLATGMHLKRQLAILPVLVYIAYVIVEFVAF